ncbi:MAG: thiamine pyrophosphate-dependent enzyme, partial [Alphaproteobacteria bacterium]|nr:thiamine pyrophosphate-dependent enzyme [Alphaproteobacteria bacterium]
AGHVGIGINPPLAERVKEADLLIVIGPRMGEATTNYDLIDIPTPRQALVHVHPGAEELGRVYQPTLPIHASVGEFLRAAAALEPVDSSAWKAATEAAHADYLKHATPTTIPGDLQLGEAIAWLSDAVPDNAIIANGAGNFAIWLHRFFKYSGRRISLGPTSGSMGYEMPAAVAAKLEAPDRMVLSFSGDGGFQMTGNELATAVQHNAPIIAFIINNGLYGTIRMHQERDYPGRQSATELYNPDYAKLAEAYGAHGETVAKTDEFAPAFERAVASGTPALIELRIDPDASTPAATLSGIREAALAKGKG